MHFEFPLLHVTHLRKGGIFKWNQYISARGTTVNAKSIRTRKRSIFSKSIKISIITILPHFKFNAIDSPPIFLKFSKKSSNFSTFFYIRVRFEKRLISIILLFLRFTREPPFNFCPKLYNNISTFRERDFEKWI